MNGDDRGLSVRESREHQYQLDWRLESARISIAYAQNAIRGAFLLNGGALVAILAFLGGRQNPVDLASVAKLAALPTFYFVAGVVLAVVVSGMSYLSQGNFTFEDQAKWRSSTARAFRVIAVVCWLAALTCFLAGAIDFVSTLSEYTVKIAK